MSELLASIEDIHVDRSRRKVSVVMAASLLVISGVAVMALFGSLIAPQNPATQNLAHILSGPGGSHWLGTDALGRDVFSRLITGARTAVVGPLLIAGGSLALGDALGLLAGYKGGHVDSLIMRWVDLMWSLPALLVVIVVAAATGGGYWLAVGLLLVLTVPFDTRVVRGATLEQVPRPYVEAGKALGVSDLRIMALHIWPNVAPVAVANTCLVFAGSLVSLSALSFLGLGVNAGSPDWGLMLAEGRQDLFLNPVAALAPGGMIVVTATAVNLMGDWLYERLSSRGIAR